uniref:Uncharacterized protein MANES_06G157100 n=1 Tax=Rhizophora mucronata TaxID=61149 RepID=A0A2P2R424_RHIMU
MRNWACRRAPVRIPTKVSISNL